MGGHGRRSVMRGIMGRDDTALGGGAAEAVEHAIGFAGDARDGVAGGAFVAEISGHGAEYIGPVAGENEAAIVANPFKFAGLVGNAELFRKFARDVARFGDAQKVEEIVGRVLVENSTAVKGLEKQHEFAWRGDVLAAFGGGPDIHHFAAQTGVGEIE